MSPAPAVVLYRGRVFHARFGPRPHRFAYRVLSVLIDIDRLAQADRACRLFSVGRWNLLGFHERDHGPADGSPLRAHVERLLAAEGMVAEPARILLLCHPRCLGFAFNPLSVYYVFGPDGALRAVLHEVRNTFGGRHSYVVPLEGGEGGAWRQSARKAFPVSPFLGGNLRYGFRLSEPGDRLRLHILASGPDGPVLAAGFTGEKRVLTSGAALAAFAAAPAMTLTVAAAIHWEALRLWLKGVRFGPRPAGRRDGGRREA